MPFVEFDGQRGLSYWVRDVSQGLPDQRELNVINSFLRSGVPQYPEAIRLNATNDGVEVLNYDGVTWSALPSNSIVTVSSGGDSLTWTQALEWLMYREVI